jgi:carbon storage regulator
VGPPPKVGEVLQRIKGIAHRKKFDRVYKCAMLILTRRAGESLRIGEDVEVTVMAVNGAQVRIGIKAPINVCVDREEVAERKRRERDNPLGSLNR